MKEGRKRSRIKSGKNKRGQIMGMPFQFLFSIILIAVTLFVAIWAIRHFMNVAECGKIGSFVMDFENKVKDVYNEYEANETETFAFSPKFDYVCFANITAIKTLPTYLKNATYYSHTEPPNENMFLIPLDGVGECSLDSAKHIDCYGKDCLVFDKNPTCFIVKGGKVSITFLKGTEYGVTDSSKVKIVCVGEKGVDCA